MSPNDELSPGPPTPPGVLGLIRQLQTRVVGEGIGAVLASGAVRSTLVAVSGAGASFAVQIALARAMGQAAFGAYALTLAFMNAALLLGKLEIDTTGVRFDPVAHLKNAPHPNAAKLLIDWITSPEGQQFYVDGGMLSAIDSPKIKYPPQYPDPKTMKVLLADPVKVAEWLKGAREKFTAIFGG